MKKIILSIALSVGVAPVVSAGIPVIDAGSIAQAVAQLQQMQQQYNQMIQQYNLQKQQYETLKNNLTNFKFNINGINNSLQDLGQMESIVKGINSASAKESSSSLKIKANQLAQLYQNQITESNTRINENMGAINSLKAQLPIANASDSIKLQSAIQDAYQQIDMEKSLQANLARTTKAGIASISKKYGTKKLVENGTKGTAWD